MKKYVVKVNGKVYEVELESVSETQGHVEAPKAEAPKAAPAPAAVAGEGASVKAPMQGNINDIKVSVGQSVNKGDTLLILEAMKLENEIVAPVSGTVKSIHVSKGQTVDNGTVLVVLG
jgi:biotin carboxyl carrier protein